MDRPRAMHQIKGLAGKGKLLPSGDGKTGGSLKFTGTDKHFRNNIDTSVFQIPIEIVHDRSKSATSTSDIKDTFSPLRCVWEKYFFRRIQIFGRLTFVIIKIKRAGLAPNALFILHNHLQLFQSRLL